MSDFQTPTDPGGLPTDDLEQRHKKLETLRILGIVSIVYGGLSLLLNIGSVAMESSLIKIAANQPGMEGLADFTNDPKIQQIKMIGIVLAVVVNALLIGGGILLAKRRLLGRTISLVGGLSAIATSIYAVFMQILVIASIQAQYNIPSRKTESLGALCCLVYPIILLVFILPQSAAKALKQEDPNI